MRRRLDGIHPGRRYGLARQPRPRLYLVNVDNETGTARAQLTSAAGEPLCRLPHADWQARVRHVYGFLVRDLEDGAFTITNPPVRQWDLGRGYGWQELNMMHDPVTPRQYSSQVSEFIDSAR
ncbi:unnamed protein product, partial [Amoebophrya sp. A25]|eukprot:GSA25T00021002001.1